VQINISTRHGHLSEETQRKIKEKLQKLTRFLDRITAIDFTVDLEHRDKPDVDLKVSAEPKHIFVAESRSVELMAALDDTIEKMEHQLRKHKEKGQDRHTRLPGHKQMPSFEMPGHADDGSDDDGLDSVGPKDGSENL
jgi:putative sigma-54 modulation protein